MAQVINDPYRNQSQKDYTANQPYVNGVSALLSGLIQGKTQELVQRKEQQKTASGLQHLLKIPSKEAHHLASLDPKLLEHVVKSKLAEPSRQAYAQGLNQIFGSDQKQQQQQNQMIPDNQSNMIMQDQSQNNPDIQQAMSVKNQQQDLQQGAIPQLGELNEKQASDLANLSLKKQKMTLEEKREQRRFEHEEKKFAHEMRKDALDETKEIRKELFGKKKAANNALESISRLEELEKEGLPTAGWSEFVKNAGLDIAALNGAPAEEYNKIAANFVRDAKAIFGNRLTDVDLQQFLKTVPSLSNSPEGRKRINANLKRIANLDIAAVDAFNDIVKKNDGIPPLDLDSQLDEALEKKRDSVYEKFKADLQKPVPASQNKFLTAAASVGGSALGTLGSAASHTASKSGPLITGALLGGRFGGPYGAAAGGAIGLLGSSVFDFLRK